MVKVKRLPDPFHPPYYDLDGYYLSLASTGTAKEYEEGSFTPTVLFGGASTGITYSDQIGRYVKIGLVVCAWIDLKMTAKGSSTGAAQIGGLPFTVQTTAGPCSIGRARNMTGLTGALTGFANPTTTGILLQQSAATGTAAITDTSFTATSDFLITCVYRAA